MAREFNLGALLNPLYRASPDSLLLGGHSLDAGRLCEMRLFGGVQPDWMDAIDSRALTLRAYQDFERAVFNPKGAQAIPSFTFGRYSVRNAPALAIDYLRRSNSPPTLSNDELVSNYV